MKRWITTTLAATFALSLLISPVGSATAAPRASVYRILHLPELAQFRDVRVVSIDRTGNLLANVSRSITVHGALVNDAHAVLDLRPGTSAARVIALRPLQGTLESWGVDMNNSGTMLVQSSIHRWIPFVGKLRGGRVIWNRLRFVPGYGSGSVVGIADNGDVAGELHGLVRKPRCCMSLRRAALWRPSGSGRYRFPAIFSPTDSAATAIWSAGKGSGSVVVGIAHPMQVVWTVCPMWVEQHTDAPCHDGTPVMGWKSGEFNGQTEAITSLAGVFQLGGRSELLGVATLKRSCCGYPTEMAQVMILERKAGDGYAITSFQNLSPPPKYDGVLCVIRASGIRSFSGTPTAVGGAGCFSKPCKSRNVACGYPPLTVALIWRNDKGQLLENLIPPHTHWWLKEADAISVTGEIGGSAWFGRASVPFLLIPRHMP